MPKKIDDFLNELPEAEQAAIERRTEELKMLEKGYHYRIDFQESGDSVYVKHITDVGRTVRETHPDDHFKVVKLSQNVGMDIVE